MDMCAIIRCTPAVVCVAQRLGCDCGGGVVARCRFQAVRRFEKKTTHLANEYDLLLAVDASYLEASHKVHSQNLPSPSANPLDGVSIYGNNCLTSSILLLVQPLDGVCGGLDGRLSFSSESIGIRLVVDGIRSKRRLSWRRNGGSGRGRKRCRNGSESARRRHPIATSLLAASN